MEHRHSNSDKTYNAQVDEGVVPTSSVVQPIRKGRGVGKDTWGTKVHGSLIQKYGSFVPNDLFAAANEPLCCF